MVENYLVAILDSSPTQGFASLLVDNQFNPECHLFNVFIKML